MNVLIAPFRKAIMRTLRPSTNDDLYRRVVEIMPGNVYLFDLTTMSRIFTNQTSTISFGYQPETVRPLGHEFLTTVIHPDDLAGVQRHLAEFATKRDGDIVRSTHRIKSANGEIRGIVKREAVFKRDSAGTPIQLVGVAQDVTDSELRTAELVAACAAQKESEEILSSFFNTSPVLMAVVEATADDIRYIYGNPATAAFLRLPVTSLGRESAKSLGVPAADVIELLAKYSEAAATRLPVTYDIKRDRAGDTSWLSSTINYIGLGSNGLPRFSLVTVNITSQKTAEQELQRLNQELETRISERTAKLDTAIVQLRESADKAFQADQHLRTVLGHLPIVLWACDLGGRVTLAEGQGLRPIGLRSSEGLGESIYTTNTENPEVNEHVRSVLRGEAVSYCSIKRGRSFEGHLAPVRDMNGEISGAVGFSVDVTERQRLAAERDASKISEKAVTEASRLKSEFLANMSHEIRTPLNGILGTARLLRETNPTPDQQQLIATMQQCGEALLSVVNDILDVTKIEAGKVTLEHRVFDVIDCLEHAISTIASRAREKGLQLSLVGNPHLPRALVGDATRISQVLINVLSNAVKFTETGEILVRAQARSLADRRCELTIAVSDSGIGISAAAQNRLFQAFNQADESTTRKFGGSGLGLAICKSMCELMDGRIWIESEPGQGSTFTFTVVATEIAAGEVPASRADVDLDFDRNFARKHPLSILVAEDNVVNRQLARQFLERLGYHPTLVANGLAAVQAQADQPFDLIFMDIHMPQIDGLEATRRIRSGEARGPRPRIVAMTASALSSSQDEAREAGMDDFLAKPITVYSLVTCIERQPRLPKLREPFNKILANDSREADEGALILARFGNDEDMCRSVAEIFINDFPRQRRHLEEAIARKNSTDIEFAAHSLRGAAGNFSSTLVATPAAELEELSISGDLTCAPALMEVIIAEAEALVTILRRIVGRRSA